MPRGYFIKDASYCNLLPNTLLFVPGFFFFIPFFLFFSFVILFLSDALGTSSKEAILGSTERTPHPSIRTKPFLLTIFRFRLIGRGRIGRRMGWRRRIELKDHRDSLRSPPPEVDHVRCLRRLCDMRWHGYAVPSGRIGGRRSSHDFFYFPIFFCGERDVSCR